MISLLQAKNLKKSFEHPIKIDILRGVDFSVAEGEIVAITGRSGEGKSTLLHLLGMLEKPTEGALFIHGEEVAALNRGKIRNQKVGFVFQAFHLLEDFPLIENVLMPAKINRQPTAKRTPAYQRAEMLIEEVGLTSRLHFDVRRLSGGERQRVAIARALCNDPVLLLADEPSGNLDRKTAEGIHDLLFQFGQKPGKAVVLVSHDETLAARCHRRYRIEDGLLY